MKKVGAIIMMALTIVSCSKTPEACFETSTTSALEDEAVKFTNCSFKAVHYEWDFGDGTTSNEEHPSKAFIKEGNYEVTLTAYNDDKSKQATVSHNMEIKDAGDRYISSIKVHSIKWKNSGKDWDAQNGPDLFFYVGPLDGDHRLIATEHMDDIEEIDMPVTLKAKEMTKPMTNEVWIFDLYEWDVSGVHRKMGRWNINPQTVQTPYEVRDGAYEFDIHFARK